MGDEDKTAYIKCRTCGRYVAESQSIKGIYCSEECADTFTRCPNCGKFFPSTQKDLHGGFCSVDCRTLYNEEGIIISSEE